MAPATAHNNDVSVNIEAGTAYIQDVKKHMATASTLTATVTTHTASITSHIKSVKACI